MNITFVLPGSSRHPVGGYKVVFEYANRLTARGNHVRIVQPAMLESNVSPLERLYHRARYVTWGSTGAFGPNSWFPLDPRVSIEWVYSLDQRNIPGGDVIIATGWPTAEFVAGCSSSKGRKFYLIQHLEEWWGDRERVRRTWTLPLRKIVISRWLEEIASRIGERATYIPNGLDFEAFGCDVPVVNRIDPKVLMLYHEMEWKGSADGIQAARESRASIPTLQMTLFGRFPRPKGLPEWARYVRNPSQQILRGLYNESAVFLAPSWTEGWDLPATEAMACGAALVCTDIDGHREYAIQGHNALLAPAKNPVLLGEQLTSMLSDDRQRFRLAENARIDVSRFTWDTAVEKFEGELRS